MFKQLGMFLVLTILCVGCVSTPTQNKSAIYSGAGSLNTLASQKAVLQEIRANSISAVREAQKQSTSYSFYEIRNGLQAIKYASEALQLMNKEAIGP